MKRRRGVFPLGVGAPLVESSGVIAAIVAPSFAFPVTVYGLLVLGVFGALWFFYDRRDRVFYEAGRRKITFHCIRCDQLYTQPAGTETAPCPRCRHENVRLKF